MIAYTPFDAYTPSNELALLPANRISYTGHHAPRHPARRSVFASIAAFFQRQSTIREMASLSDRELTDIGLSRSDLDRVFDVDFSPRDQR